MTIDEITAYVESLGDVLTLRPGPGDGSPEIAWGDLFFYFSPDGVLPPGQPFATVVMKNYPDEPDAGLDRPGAFRVNVAAGSTAFRTWTGGEPTVSGGGRAPDDTIAQHPVYGGLGWLCVVNPGERTAHDLRGLLRTAHELAAHRRRRRSGE